MFRGQHGVFREQRGHRSGQLPALTRRVSTRVRPTPHVRVLDFRQGGHVGQGGGDTWAVLPQDRT